MERLVSCEALELEFSRGCHAPHCGGKAPIIVVQTIGTVSPEQSFMRAAANGRDGWFCDGPLQLCWREKRTFRRWQAQLSHQTKKYDLKSKHCGAQTDLGTTRAKVVEALTEVRRAKSMVRALIFDDQLCELHSSNTEPAHQRRAGQCQMSSERTVIFSTTNRERP